MYFLSKILTQTYPIVRYLLLKWWCFMSTFFFHNFPKVCLQRSGRWWALPDPSIGKCAYLEKEPHHKNPLCIFPLSFLIVVRTIAIRKINKKENSSSSSKKYVSSDNEPLVATQRWYLMVLESHIFIPNAPVITIIIIALGTFIKKERVKNPNNVHWPSSTTLSILQKYFGKGNFNFDQLVFYSHQWIIQKFCNCSFTFLIWC